MQEYVYHHKDVISMQGKIYKLDDMIIQTKQCNHERKPFSFRHSVSEIQCYIEAYRCNLDVVQEMKTLKGDAEERKGNCEVTRVVETDGRRRRELAIAGARRGGVFPVEEIPSSQAEI